MDDEDIEKPFYHCIIIPENAQWLAYFNIFMMIWILYSSIEVLLMLCYSLIIPKWLHYPVEVFYFLDIFFNFIHEYRDPDTQELVSNIRKIAYRYVIQGNFIIDFLATFPFELVILDE